MLLPALLCAVAAHALADTDMVGSEIHKMAVQPPDDLKMAASGGGGGSGKDAKGYHHSHKSRGGDGYKTFDSFHKKDGDSFGYEKHSAFGNGDSGDDGGEYHQSSSYDSGDARAARPKATSYHYESKSGTPRDYSNYDPETYEGEDTRTHPRTARPPPPPPPRDAEVVGPLGDERFQSLSADSTLPPATVNSAPQRKMRRQRPKNKSKDPQAAGTEDDAEYDYYYVDGGEAEGDGGGSYEAGFYGGDYEGEGDAESDYYY